MKKTMKKRLITTALLVAALFVSGLYGTTAMAAPREMEVDYDEYSLWVDETPEGIYDDSYIAAKLLKSGLDPEEFIITMIDDVDAENKLHKAMNSANLKPENNRNFAMDVKLYKYDEEEGDYYESKASNVEVIVPISDNLYQLDAEEEPYLQTNFLKVVNVNSSGKLSYPAFELVSIDEVICAKFTITDAGVYGYILNGVATLKEDEEEPIPTPTPIKPAPTKAPEATPTKAAATPTKAPATPTKAAAASEKDKTPKTGDDHNSTLPLLMGSFSALVLGAVVIALKKDRENEE